MDRERERKLKIELERGKKAETLRPFLQEFYELEKQRAIVDLLQSRKDPETVRADMKAAKRLVDYINNIFLRGELADRKLSPKEDK